MPAIGVVDGGWELNKEIEGVEEGGETDDLMGEGISEECIKGGRYRWEKGAYMEGSREGKGRGRGKALKRMFAGHYV